MKPIKPLSRIFPFSFLLLVLIFSSISSEEIYTVEKVIDGDTIILSNGEEVRLIGVDTPEKLHPLKPVQYFAEEASEFTRRLTEGKKVRLEFDWQKRDEYNRLLAYVYILHGNIFLNAEIIKQGYGFAYTKYPFKYLEKFREYEKEAREKGIGLWKGGGETELSWLKSKGRSPFQVYDMANGMWAIEYGQFVKTRISDEELLSTLQQARVWFYELDEKDLKDQLLKNGWQEK
jgi:endonuclease YncB( thermonuclease family)